MGLFSQDQMDQINAVAAKSKEVLKPIQVSKNITSNQHEIEESSRAVLEYFGNSPAILITTIQELHDYITEAIKSGFCALDTETTGLDRIRDTIVGFSLYYPGGVECYIPNKHIVPIFETPYKNQLSYEECGAELRRLSTTDTKVIFANADFDLAMVYKDFKADLISVCYYDVILAWRCLKEDEKNNSLKGLYMKYVKGGKGDPKSFSDFFKPELFPYCKPEVAKLYAANDAKITYELFVWQLPFVTKNHPKCQKNHLEKLADLVWNIEFPMIRVCALMHRTGVYLDIDTAGALKTRYHKMLDAEFSVLSDMVQDIISQADAMTIAKSPFKTGKDFNQSSPPQVKYLITKFLKLDVQSSDKDALTKINLPVTKQILKVRSLNTLINSFVDKLPNVAGPDGRVHSTFKSIGADTGRMSSADPNVQNIPSHALDIRHQFRATPAMEKFINCTASGELDNLQVTLDLGSYDSLTMVSGEQRDVIDLNQFDNIKIFDTDDAYISIREINHELPKTTLVCNIIGKPVYSFKIRYVTPPYVMMSSDYSQQEPKMTAFVSQDPNMVRAFKEGKDIYSTIASLAFNVPYEECMEFNPVTGANQPEGKARRSQAKGIVLGITYGLSIKSLGETLFGKNKDMTEEVRTKEAQKIYDAVLNAFPNLRSFMVKAQNDARKYGYVETILGRRRHIPDMQLKPYEFKAGSKYVNPDVDPLDPTTLQNKDEIPERIVKQLEREFSNYKYMGQVYKRIKELAENEHITVVTNTKRINDATRKCVNSIVQGSAAEMTKIAIQKVFNNPEWNAIGGRVLLPVHDELIAEAPLRNADKAGELLSRLMSEAGNFLPFKINCDVTTTLRWYGLAYPCIYEKPTSLDNVEQLTPSQISWIQYHLFELEYPLPIHKKDGIKLEGDPAVGVDGEWSTEVEGFINDYINRYRISKPEFINHIEEKVVYDLQKF